jgi:hypothetical protein
MNLGYPEPAARKAVEAALAEAEAEPGLQDLLRRSLALMGQR